MFFRKLSKRPSVPVRVVSALLAFSLHFACKKEEIASSHCIFQINSGIALLSHGKGSGIKLDIDEEDIRDVRATYCTRSYSAIIAKNTVSISLGQNDLIWGRQTLGRTSIHYQLHLVRRVERVPGIYTAVPISFEQFGGIKKTAQKADDLLVHTVNGSMFSITVTLSDERAIIVKEK